MPIISAPQDFHVEDLYVALEGLLGRALHLKCEGFNFAGSGKLKAASEMISAAEHSGLLDHSSVLIESSSGNMGVALSMIAASRGYTFVCVTDPRCNLTTKRLMESLGSQVHTITEPDDDGAFLAHGCPISVRYVRLMIVTSGLTSTATPITGKRIIGGRRLRSVAGSRSWTCCLSVRVRPGR